MSRIIFSSRDKRVDVSGRERGLMGQYCSRALLLSLGELFHLGDKEPWIMKYIPSGCYLKGLDQGDPYRLIQSIKTWLQVADGGAYLSIDGKQYPLFTLQLNSALAIGSDAFKLAAKLHAQCEIHCWVDGPNRLWLSSIIQDALDKNIFRKDMGWDKVIELLVSSNDGPVVCSYSVCETFPNRSATTFEGDEDAYWDLTDDERWNQGMAYLRSHTGELEIRKDKWNDFYFGDSPVSGFDIVNGGLGKS